MKKYRIGYTQGVYDMFHVGHLNLINHAKKYCDYLIVGINADDLVIGYKNKKPVISQEQRRYIVENIKAVDKAVIVKTLDKVEMLRKYKFNAIFIGDDWKGNSRWEATKKELSKYNTDVVFLPYTSDISSTALKLKYNDKIKE